MVSKKKRPKAMKTMAEDVETGTANTDLCVESVTEKREISSPFLRLPREVRDKIYDELLVARLSPERQEKYDQLVAADKTPGGELSRANALDLYEQEVCLMPGSNQNDPSVVAAMGLLLANKEIHEEANTTLFSRNTFLILVEWERVFPFWRCENKRCYPPGVPYFITFHNFKKIKHLYILATNTRALSDPLLNADSLCLEKNLKIVAKCFLEGGNKLKTLKIRYTSCFEGQIDAVRDSLEGELPKGMPARKTMLKDKYGKYHLVSRKEAPIKLFKHHKILDPLKHLKGIADDVKIRGDLPQAYMDELAKVLSKPVSDVSHRVKKKREAEAAERKKRQDQEQESGFHAFMKQMAEQYKGTDTEQYYLDCLKVPAKSPAVMADLFKPPTQEEMNGWRQIRQAGPPPGPPVSWDDVTDASEDEEPYAELIPAGSIAMLDGTPVFGPVRSPALL